MAVTRGDAAHLLRRTGFGVTPTRLAEIMALPDRAAAIARVTDVSLAEPATDAPIGGGWVEEQWTAWYQLTWWWMERMRTSRVPLVEKMVLFWHNHFVSSQDKLYDIGLLYTQNQLFRTHALGDLHTLTQAVAVDPSMLWYLDNAENVAGREQENFAREVMELFTMGQGNFTEADVITMAKAWTGHNVTEDGRQYAFYPAEHDGSSKVLFGITRPWDGPATLTEILEGSRSVASSRFITAKLFSYLAYPVAVTDPLVATLADGFRAADLSILSLVRAILHSDAFWGPTARYALVRNPTEWFVAGMEAIGLPPSELHPEWWMEGTGQQLFYPPNVAGWKQNSYWISTASAWARSSWGLLRPMAGQRRRGARRDPVPDGGRHRHPGLRALRDRRPLPHHPCRPRGMGHPGEGGRRRLVDPAEPRPAPAPVPRLPAGLRSTVTADLEYEALLPLLSVPAAVHDPGGLSRRRFLQGALATAGVASLSSTVFARGAFGATPIANSEGVLVIVMLGGGNDGLNTLAPISGTDRSRYQTLRGTLALPATQLLPAAEGYGFHPRLAKLSARYNTGRVAVVRGVGQTTANDLSHFSSMASFIAGSAGSSRSSGWLGRYLDGLSEHDSGMRGLTFSSSVPLHLLGQQAKVTAVPDEGGMWGAARTESWETKAHAAVEAFAGGPTGLSQWGDRVAQNGKAAVGMAQTIDGLYHPDVTTQGLTHDLTLAARLINANLGARVIGVSVAGSFDTHSNQPYEHAELLGQLDDGIDAFFATLAAGFKDQVTLATFSEFGRRPERNDSNGTDHGTASVMLVVGENVKGGMHGGAPSLTTFDARANFVPTVDYRQVYATLLEKWLDGDPTQILGGSYAQLDLFTNVPGGPRVITPPPPPPNPAKPFPDWTALVRQQYADLLLLPDPAPADVSAWVSRLVAGTDTPVSLIAAFMASLRGRNDVQPVLRAHRGCVRRVPTRAQLTANVAQLRASGLVSVCSGIVGSTSFRQVNGVLTDSAYVRWLFTTFLGVTPSTASVNARVSKLRARTATRGSLLAEFVTHATAVARFRNEVFLAYLFAGMVHAVPTSASWTSRLNKLNAGVAPSSMVAEVLGGAGYAARVS